MTAITADLDCPAKIGNIPTSALAAQGNIEITQRVCHWTERKGVVIASVAPTIADVFMQIGFAITVSIVEARQFALLNQVNLSINDFKSKRLIQSASESMVAGRVEWPGGVLYNPHLSRPRTNRQITIGEKVQAGDHHICFLRQGKVLYSIMCISGIKRFSARLTSQDLCFWSLSRPSIRFPILSGALQ